MKKNHLILGLIVLIAMVALGVYAQHRYPFHWGTLWAQLKAADWVRIAIGAGCIYLAYCFRSVRWAILLRHNKKVSLFGLLGTQVIGFTAVALIGRVADPVRPYLVSKRTGLPLSSQLAVYVVERLFDLGSTALIFSSVILFTVWYGQPGALPHPEIVKKAGYWGMGLTLAGALFLVAVRISGGLVASFLERSLGILSKKLGQAVGDKVRGFRAGLDTIRTLGDFAAVTGLSLGMWMVIAFAYLETTRAFVASPPLAAMTWPKCMLLLAFSGGASVFQLPVIGWFWQVGAVAAALTAFYGATPEAATACAATILLVTFLSIVPVGLIWAQFEHVSLRKITAESEHASEELGEQAPAEKAAV
ncbi:MAG: lysylphosphatidylglycerol synthase transmembrane domain-containing protein [Terracidiphilus sp.]